MQKYNNSTSIANILFAKLEKINLLPLVEELFYLSISYNDKGRINYFNEDAINLGRNLMPYINAKYSLQDESKAKEAIENMVIDIYGIDLLNEVVNDLLKDSIAKNESLMSSTKVLYRFAVAVSNTLKYSTNLVPVSEKD